jgi:putative membrane protein insertion efficiency factor
MRAYALLGRELVTALLVTFVRAYRVALTPFFGPCCRFEPSCSAYTEDCLRIHGPLGGAWLGLRRILRCHPFSTGGLDPVPSRAGTAPPDAAARADLGFTHRRPSRRQHQHQYQHRYKDRQAS